MMSKPDDWDRLTEPQQEALVYDHIADEMDGMLDLIGSLGSLALTHPDVVDEAAMEILVQLDLAIRKRVMVAGVRKAASQLRGMR